MSIGPEKKSRPKKVKTFAKWTIYLQVETWKNKDGSLFNVDNYLVFLPDESPAEFFSPEWEAGSIQEAIDFIKSY